MFPEKGEKLINDEKCPKCGNPWWIKKIGGYVCTMCHFFIAGFDAMTKETE